MNDVRGVGSKQGRCGSIHHVNDVRGGGVKIGKVWERSSCE